MDSSLNERFENIMNQYSKMIFGIAYNYTKNVCDSEDIVQDVFLKFYRAHKTFDNDEYLKYWLIRVAINQSLNVLKQKKNEIFMNNEFMNNLPDSLNDNENNDFMYDCVCKLKNDYKNIIILYYYNDYSIKEISMILKMKENTIKSKLNRARIQLKEIINEKGENNGKR